MAKRKRSRVLDETIEQAADDREHSIKAANDREDEARRGKPHDIKLLDLAETYVAQTVDAARVKPRNRSEAEAQKAKFETNRALSEVDFMRDGIVVPMLRAVLGKSRAHEGIREAKEAWYDNEIDALKALYSSYAPSRLGACGRALQTGMLGASIQSSGESKTPTPHPALENVARVLAKLDPADVRLLVWTYVEFTAPTIAIGDFGEVTGGQVAMSAQTLAASIREGKLDDSQSWTIGKLGALKGAGLALPKGSALTADGGLRAASIVAERLGLPVDTEDALASSTRVVAGKVKRARGALRKALQAIELDVEPRWIITPPEARELRDERGAEVAVVKCCAGPAFSDGVRLPCREVGVEGRKASHPSAAWPECVGCGLAVVMGRRMEAAEVGLDA